MKRSEQSLNKDLYGLLRSFSCDQLWNDEVPRFDSATPDKRSERVAVIRAVGVVFSESGTPQQKDEVRRWLVRLLRDSNEKVRRYAMAALPKIGAGHAEEADLLALLRTTASETERKFLAQALNKIGGTATLKTLEEAGGSLLSTAQKVRANVARSHSPGAVRMDGILSEFAGLRIHLRGRKGLEGIVRDEVEGNLKSRNTFRVTEVRSGLVSIKPIAPFALADIYSLRCFGTVGFVVGTVDQSIEAIASAVTLPLSRHILKAFTQGSIRYRLDFISKGHQRGAVRRVADRVYAICPEILNDARNALWSVDIHPMGMTNSVELRPRLVPDPRFSYRQDDVPAASHPPLAACMARLAGRVENEIVWDPFCGSGMELVERALLGGVRSVYGTDRSSAAIAIAQKNFAAAKAAAVPSRFTCGDFRDFRAVKGLEANSVTLIISNPPMGKRVPVPNLRGLIEDLFTVSEDVLRPGGRLVFANPLPVGPPSHSSLKLQSRQVVDFGGFDCRLERYVKAGR